MKINSIFCFLLALITLVGCDNGKKPIDSIACLKGTNMGVDSLFNGRFLYDINDNYILMRSYDKDNLIQLLELDNNHLLTSTSFLKEGEGPMDVNRFTVCTEDSILWILDFKGGMHKMLQLNYGKEIGDENRNWNVINLSEEVKKLFTFGSSAFKMIDESSMLFIGGKFDTKELLSIYSIETGEIHSLLFWPNDKKKIPNQIKQSVYMSNSQLFKKEKSNRFLYKSDNGKVLVAFDLKCNNVSNLNYIYKEYPDYEIKEDGLNYRVLYPNDKSYEEIEVCVNNDYIYVMTTPNIQNKEYKGFPYYYGDNVKVFDWNGNKVKEFTTEYPFHSFVVDDTNTFLYTMTLDLDSMEKILVRYSLSSNK